MGRLKPEKLSVEFRKGVTPKEPIIPRRYTLTHCDSTAELFLTIGEEYAYDKINPMRDEVFGEWVEVHGQCLYNVYLYVDGGEFTSTVVSIRDGIFRRELPLALEAIRCGDSEFFKVHPKLNNASIMVYFQSGDPRYNKVENWGCFSQYDSRVALIDEKKFRISNKEEGTIVTLLNPYIEKVIFKIYGRNERFCLTEVEVAGIEEVKTGDRCRPNYDVFVTLKVGNDPRPLPNLIIGFRIMPNRVLVQSVRQPR